MTDARPILAVVNGQPVGDGVGYVGLLLRRALDDAFGAGATRYVALNPTSAPRVRPMAAASFIGRLALAQRAAPPIPVVFNHVGIARAELLLPSSLRRPYAVFLHGVEAWDPAMGAARRAAIRGAAVRLANLYTAERLAVEDPELGALVGVPLALLPESPTPSRADEERVRELLTGDEGPRAVIVGRMSADERYKGHDALLECWSEVRAAVPGARLMIVGKGDDVERLKAKAAGLGVSPNVTFTGYLSDGAVRLLLRAATVFAMPSRGEGFGLAYLVAMREGLPCIGSTEDAARLVISPGETGLLVDPEDRRAIARAVVSILVNRDLRTRLGEAGRRREAEAFSYDRFRRTVLAALHAPMEDLPGPLLATQLVTDRPRVG